MNSITTLTPQQLRQAADVQEKIQDLQDELNQLLGAPSQAPTVAAESTTETPTKRTFSAASRAKMRQAQKERWARIKGTTAESAPTPEAPKKRKLSPLAIANIRAGVAKRMAKKGGKAAVSEAKPKLERSAAWRKAISLAAKARWAKAKAAGERTL
jgi:hypothetical protein